jgi:hypothetical protein
MQSGTCIYTHFSLYRTLVGQKNATVNATCQGIFLRAIGSPALVLGFNCWPVTTEGWVRSQASQDGICGIRSGDGTGSSPKSFC